MNWRVTLLRQHHGNTEEESGEIGTKKSDGRLETIVKLKLRRIICSVLMCQPHLFTSDKLSSNLVSSVELLTLLRPSIKLSTACSTLLQEPVGEKAAAETLFRCHDRHKNTL